MSKEKVAVYCATRNLYRHLPTAVYSLLYNNPSIDRVLCIIEDDSKPFDISDKVEFINYRKMPQLLSEDSPNRHSYFTYMASARLCFHEWFRGLDKVLYLDVDTIVDRRIDDLWRLPMRNKAVAGVAENRLTDGTPGEYINSGVLFMNLDYLWKSGLGTKMLEEYNTELHKYPDQDVINKVCKGKIAYLPCEYNEFACTGITPKPKIVHFAGVPFWWEQGRSFRYMFLKKYKDMMGRKPL